MVAEGVINKLSSEVSNVYLSFINSLGDFGIYVNLLILVLLVVIFSVFIWKFYRFIAKKDFLELDLNQYNNANDPFSTYLLAGLFYFLEYLLISPFLIFFWFAVFTLFLIIMTQGHTTLGILVISTVVVSSIRITSYFNEDLSKELAKLLPFTLLAISLINPKFFELGRIFNDLNKIPSFLDNIIWYLLFILVLEIILRFFDFIISLFSLEEE